MQSDNKTFYIILVVAILIIIYLFWKKNQERTYVYREFKANLNNDDNTNMNTNNGGIINNINGNQKMSNVEFNDLINKLQQFVTQFRQDFSQLQQNLGSYDNRQLSQ